MTWDKLAEVLSVLNQWEILLAKETTMSWSHHCNRTEKLSNSLKWANKASYLGTSALAGKEGPWSGKVFLSRTYYHWLQLKVVTKISASAFSLNAKWIMGELLGIFFLKWKKQNKTKCFWCVTIKWFDANKWNCANDSNVTGWPLRGYQREKKHIKTTMIGYQKVLLVMAVLFFFFLWTRL